MDANCVSLSMLDYFTCFIVIMKLSIFLIKKSWVLWSSYTCNLTIFACYPLLSFCSVCMLRVMFIQILPNFRRVNILYSYIWGMWVRQHYLFDVLQDCADYFPHASLWLIYNSLPKVLSSFWPWDMRLSVLEF